MAARVKYMVPADSLPDNIPFDAQLHMSTLKETKEKQPYSWCGRVSSTKEFDICTGGVTKYLATCIILCNVYASLDSHKYVTTKFATLQNLH